jgi:hypothetical protein
MSRCVIILSQFDARSAADLAPWTGIVTSPEKYADMGVLRTL